MHCFLNLFMIIIESHKTGGEAAGLATNTVLFIYPFTEILAFFTWNSKRVPKILTFDPGARSRSNLGQTMQKKM